MTTPAATRWYRGQLHTHSYWSDGRGFPDEVAAVYKSRGYDFLSLTDHNRFAVDQDFWQEVVEEEGKWPPKISRARFDDYCRMFEPGWVESRVDEKSTRVRLKTFADLKCRFEEAGRFILIPGVETTQMLGDIHLHMNYINLPLLIPCVQNTGLIKKAAEPATIKTMIDEQLEQTTAAAQELDRPSLLMLNHPYIFFCDISAQSLIDSPQVRFFEICNNGSNHPPFEGAGAYGPEQFWDAVNAFRCSRGQPLLLGVGSDDAHFYDAKRIGGESGVGDAWIMVRSTELTIGHLIDAMHRSDFYATCGVLLRDVLFSEADRTLKVKVQPEPGTKYRIEFVTTKRGFDTRVGHVVSTKENGRPVRTLPIYSDDIGRVVAVFDGDEASYRMAEDDLYVRARVVSDRPAQVKLHFHPKHQTAWTQPYANRV